ncbi:MAG: SGNH/GDSL hydrolase family protein [Chloroflexi bacterium]|nr:SGNH/GDSL hydrolase family protein [Ardenticatenaceae bacterium]NOG36404.1 SGNH/GDSL hydrolase family protein [Chloroflexota bacterium]
MRGIGLTGFKRPARASLLWFCLAAVLFTACHATSSSPTAVPPTISIAAINTATHTTVPPTATVTPTSMPTHTPTVVPPTITPTPPHLLTPTPVHPGVFASLTPTPVPTLVNGLILEDFLIMDEITRQHVRAIYQQGQAAGRNPHTFSKLGDSGAVTGYYLTRFDYPPHYTLGDYAYLQPVITHFRKSFQRYGVAVAIGISSWHVLDPARNNPTWCAPEEHMLACEIRLHNPSILLIRLGTNDQSSAAVLQRNLRRIVTYTIEQGVIPILATKADRYELEYDTNNAAIRELAAEMHIPLWDFDRVAATLPNHGLLPDQVHLSHSDRNDYTDPATFTKGYPMNDLTALFVLQEILAVIAEEKDVGLEIGD